jgi:hypothetical protein
MKITEDNCLYIHIALPLGKETLGGPQSQCARCGAELLTMPRLEPRFLPTLLVKTPAVSGRPPTTRSHVFLSLYAGVSAVRRPFETRLRAAPDTRYGSTEHLVRLRANAGVRCHKPQELTFKKTFTFLFVITHTTCFKCNR